MCVSGSKSFFDWSSLFVHIIAFEGFARIIIIMDVVSVDRECIYAEWELKIILKWFLYCTSSVS